MMSRRQLREQIFKLLFRAEFHAREDMPEQEAMFLEETAAGEEQDERQIDVKYRRIMERLDQIDGELNRRAKGWTTGRMGKVELTILRLAVYEMMFDEDVPTSVAINEAVELAKKFGRDESPAFVNGVLARFA